MEEKRQAMRFAFFNGFYKFLSKQLNFLSMVCLMLTLAVIGFTSISICFLLLFFLSFMIFPFLLLLNAK